MRTGTSRIVKLYYICHVDSVIAFIITRVFLICHLNTKAPEYDFISCCQYSLWSLNLAWNPWYCTLI